MSGGNFATKGATPPPANTVYFGYVPDRFNVLTRQTPGSGGNSGGIFDASANAALPANLVSNWQVYNPGNLGQTAAVTASFGANTSAPDGSNNGVHVTEGTNNGIHAVCASWLSSVGQGGCKIRCSVFAKVAERTRFALCIGTFADLSFNFAGGGAYGCKTIFDVGGGQIGIANAIFNSAFGTNGNTYTPGPTEIVNFGGGWYRCTMDVLLGKAAVGGATQTYFFNILIDHGSGTGAENTAYVGDGASGLYFWRSTALPPGAWGINTVNYFEDFTSLSGFDLAKTNNPGFNWYLDYNWPGFVASPQNNPIFTDPTKLSIVSGTQLKIATNPGEDNLAIQSAAPHHPGDGGFVLGNLWQPGNGILLECSYSFDGFTNASGNGPTFWSRAIEGSTPVNINAVTQSAEFDLPEYTPGGHQAYDGSTFSCGPSGGTGIFGFNIAANGYPIWYSTYTYGVANLRVSYLGAVYQSTQSVPVGTLPTNVTFWTLVTPGPQDEPQLPIAVDWTQLHVRSTLWLLNSPNDVGQILSFFDGRYCYPQQGGAPGHLIYTPTTLGVGGTPSATISERLHYPFFFGTASTQNTFVDYIRTTQ